MTEKRLTMDDLRKGKRDVKVPPCFTVSDLIDELEKLPSDLPINGGFDHGVQPIIYNQKTKPVLIFEEADNSWDDDDWDEEEE